MCNCKHSLCLHVNMQVWFPEHAWFTDSRIMNTFLKRKKPTIAEKFSWGISYKQRQFISFDFPKPEKSGDRTMAMTVDSSLAAFRRRRMQRRGELNVAGFWTTSLLSHISYWSSAAGKRTCTNDTNEMDSLMSSSLRYRKPFSCTYHADNMKRIMAVYRGEHSSDKTVKKHFLYSMRSWYLTIRTHRKKEPKDFLSSP